MQKKKNGQNVFDLTNIDIQTKTLAKLPVEDIWGISRGWSKRLHNIGIQNALQLRDCDPSFIRNHLSVIGERIVYELRGVSCIGLEKVMPKKNILSSKSFGKLVTELEEVEEALANYAFRACQKLRNQNSKTQGIYIFLKTNKYRKNDKEIRKIYTIYQSELLRLNSVDFGDLILFCIKIFQKNKNILSKYQNIFKYIHVDEYQDINPIQQQWIHFLYKGNKNICCVGDDDQSIYSWRGADVSNLLNFEKNFENVTIVRLEQNYRSTRNILSCASTLISKNKGRYGKELWSKNQIGEKITINGFWETKEESVFVTDKIENIIKDKINLSEISILFRVAAHTRSFEERLINLGLPYKIIGGLRFYERKEIKDIIAYLRLTNNQNLLLLL